jgi:hypothetical protein
MTRFWRAVQATTIVFCALPGIVFVFAGPVDARVSHLFLTPAAQHVWEVVFYLDYFTMIGLSPILAPLMWFVRGIWCKSFSPTAKGVLTSIAVAGTLGTAFFWIRLFS